jgi:integrase
MAEKLTDRLVRSLVPPEKGNRVTYDTDVKGFGVRITAAGAVAFILNYRRRSDALERRYTIGNYPDWGTAAARERAKELKRHVDNGGDPVGEHVAERAAPTVAELCARFLEEHVAKQRPHTQRDYCAIIHGDILPALGKLKVVSVDFAHIERLHHKITLRAPVLANRVLAVASKMFSLAIRWRMRPDNPCKGVARNQEHHRRRYLTPDEQSRLLAALAKHPSQEAADAIRLLLLTGARRGEVLNATWDQFDLAAGTWSKPPTTTKQKEHHQVPLAAPARELLARLHKQANGSPYVFPGRGGKQAKQNLSYSWQVICKAAGITGLRIHDLRHSFASSLISGGSSLPVIGALLGHSQPSTTARYAHLYHDPLRAAVERHGAAVVGKPPAEVKPLHRRRP